MVSRPASHPDHAVARQQMQGYGGVVSFEIEGDGAQPPDLSMLCVCPTSPLHWVASIASSSCQPSCPTTKLLWKNALLGVRDELVRFAIGIEDPDDIILILPRRSPMFKMIFAARYPAQPRLIVSCLYQRRQGIWARALRNVRIDQT